MTMHAIVQDHYDTYSSLHELQRTMFRSDGETFVAFGKDAEHLVALPQNTEIDFNVDMALQLITGEKAYLVSHIVS